MRNHPLWSVCHVNHSRYSSGTYYSYSGNKHNHKAKIMIEITQRNLHNTYPQWIPVSVRKWLTDELNFREDDAKYAEDMIIGRGRDIANDLDFRQTLEDGIRVLRMYSDYHERTVMEDRCEIIYSRARGSRKPNSSSPSIIGKSILEYLIGSDMSVEDIDEAVVYTKYRHCEFTKNFELLCSDRKFDVTLTMFAYKLPEKKPVDEWN